ncbi:MAG: glutamyl-tRNA reductase [Planctomycetota bacterium]
MTNSKFETGLALPADKVHLAGMNHKTAPLDLREKVAFSTEEAPGVLARVKTALGNAEIVAVSTCNRTEIVWAGREMDPARLFAAVFDAQSSPSWEGALFAVNGRRAVEHVFRVACGLESMVMGETQVLHQLRRAYDRSLAAGLTGSVLNPLYQRAFRAAKEVHTRTKLASRHASVPAVAMDLAAALFENLAAASVVVIGTGETGILVLETLRKRGAGDIAVVSRDPARARGVCGTAAVHPWGELPRLLAGADILIACAATDAPVVTEIMIREAFPARRGRHRPLLVLDLAVPRNVAPEAGRFEEVYLRNLDDLRAVAERNRAGLEGDLVAVREILAAHLDDYFRDSRASAAAAVARDLHGAMEQAVDVEITRLRENLAHLPPADRAEVEAAVRRIVDKFLDGKSNESGV